jgi:hypothetical protein
LFFLGKGGNVFGSSDETFLFCGPPAKTDCVVGREFGELESDFEDTD